MSIDKTISDHKTDLAAGAVLLLGVFADGLAELRAEAFGSGSRSALSLIIHKLIGLGERLDREERRAQSCACQWEQGALRCPLHCEVDR